MKGYIYIKIIKYVGINLIKFIYLFKKLKNYYWEKLRKFKICGNILCIYLLWLFYNVRMVRFV